MFIVFFQTLQTWCSSEIKYRLFTWHRQSGCSGIKLLQCMIRVLWMRNMKVHCFFYSTHACVCIGQITLMDKLSPSHHWFLLHCACGWNERERGVGGCILSPLLYSFTIDCISKHACVQLVKFTDNTTVEGLVEKSDESACHQELCLGVAAITLNWVHQKQGRWSSIFGRKKITCCPTADQ